MLLMGYSVVVLTVLSISAIATNGNVEGGGVYCILMMKLIFAAIFVSYYIHVAVCFGVNEFPGVHVIIAPQFTLQASLQ